MPLNIQTRLMRLLATTSLLALGLAVLPGVDGPMSIDSAYADDDGINDSQSSEEGDGIGDGDGNMDGTSSSTPSDEDPGVDDDGGSGGGGGGGGGGARAL